MEDAIEVRTRIDEGDDIASAPWTSVGIARALDDLLVPSRRTTRIEIDAENDLFWEVDDTETTLTPETSTAMTRKPGPKKDSIMGSSTGIPFLPGGFQPLVSDNSQAENCTIGPDPCFDFIDCEGDVHPHLEWLDCVLEIDKNATPLQVQPELKTENDENENKNLMIANSPDLISRHVEIESNLQEKLLNENLSRKVELHRSRRQAEKDAKDIVSMSSIFGHDVDGIASQFLSSSSQSKTDPVSTPKNENYQVAEDVDTILSVVPETSDSIEPVKQERWAFHETLKPKSDINFKEVIKEMAIEYPFELDSFQQQAILHLEKGESVFVAAHTSAGKTVVAEYAIALCIKHMTKAVYTSPIKTLSNQKFREFKKTFGEVGLITGDVQINPEASCLIVTTEILRSMLYKGADVIRDIEWCIFDEVHYINDLERGVVWEEVIIMLPAHVNVILLSATVPNPLEFAEWVGRTKRKHVYVISTSQRPVPLQHYLWCNDRMYNILNANSKFVAEGFKNAHEDLSKKSRKLVQTGQQKRMTPQTGNWISLLRELKENKQLPVVVFSFSKKMCELAASGLYSQNLTDASEKSEIHVLCETSLKRLPECDRELPQIIRIKEMLSRGIGVHHSGLLPVVKELVEMAFGKGVVKLLFATETFAMGVNMPTKTVVFNGLRKHDGNDFRDLLPGEYTQMAGRAGRRGLDLFGNVVINCGDGKIPDQETIRAMITGKATALQSKFRLTFSMILNLLRVEELRVEDMIKRSFCEFYTQKNESQNKAKISQGEKILNELAPIDCIYGDPHLIEQYYDLHEDREIRRNEVLKWMMLSPACDRYINTGRVLIVSIYNLIKVRSVIVSGERTTSGKKIVALLLCPPDWVPTRSMQKNNHTSAIMTWGVSLTAQPFMITNIRYSNINMVCSETIRLDKNEILVEERGSAIQFALNSLQVINVNTVQELHPIRDMKLKEMDLVLLVKDLEALPELGSIKCHGCPKLDEHFTHIKNSKQIAHRLDRLRFVVSDNNVELIADMKLRIKVLQRFNYIDNDRALLLKGRVACEINTCDCLIITELIFENVFADIEPDEAAALLSCLIFQGKTDDVPNVTGRLAQLRDQLTEIATSLGNLQLECGMDVTSKSYIAENINFGLIEVVHEWAKGTSFAKICDITAVDEGLIVRCIVRLAEVCRDVRNAARVIGDVKLFQLMDAAALAIKRDIVFAASLYVA